MVDGSATVFGFNREEMRALISRDLWTSDRQVTLDVSRAGKPTENGYIEAIKSKPQAESLKRSSGRSRRCSPPHRQP